MLKESRGLAAKVYIWSIIVAGLAVIGYSFVETLKVPSLDWMVLALLTGIASLFPVYLPRSKGKDRGLILTVSSIFTFTSILVYGPAVAAMLSVVESCVAAWKTRRLMTSVHKVLFNVAVLPLVTFAIAKFFYFAYGKSAPLNPQATHNLTALFLLLGISGFLYFLLNTASVTLVISLVTGNPFRQTWQQSFLSAALTNFAESSAAVVVFLNFYQKSVLAVGIALPTAVVIYYAYKMNLTRIHEAQLHVEKINELYHATIEALAMAVDAKDQVTHGHIHRVQAMALGLARFCGVQNEEDLEALRAASLLHDIGKLATPDYILNKPGSLTDAEMEAMKAHASVGAEILSSVPFPYPVIPLVRHHHEKWDGSGYPDGLAGEDIPLGARILSIADCYDALRSDRPYRGKLSREASLEYLISESGKSYDPVVVEQMVAHIDELEMELTAMMDDSESPQLESSREQSESWLEKGLSNTVFHDIASAHREVQALHEISQAVGRLLNVSETLTLLSDRVGKLVPHDSCAIFLMDSSNQSLAPYHTDGLFADGLGALQVHVGEGVTGWVAANHRPLLNVSPAPDFKTRRELASKLRSCVATPLLLDQNVVGVVTLYSTKANAFRHDHLRILENISHYAATALNNAIVFEETKEDAYTDLLTGLPNMRYFKVFAEQELKRAERASYPVTLMMMDLDFFKKVNDDYGHNTGDRVLIEISHVLRNQLRKSDTCIRYGGDEFVGILPGLGKDEARRIADKLQAAVDSHVIHLNGGETVQVGLSVGCATLPSDGVGLDQLLGLADAEMYRNKVHRSSEGAQTAQLIPFSRGRSGAKAEAGQAKRAALSK